MLSPSAPVVLLQHGGLNDLSGKTGLAMLRYRRGPIVAVIDPAFAGSDLQEVSGIERAVPVVADMAAALAYGPEVAVVGLAYLIVIHKLEYFLNARIVGAHISARAWEMLTAMLVMEAAFGIPGLIAAPIYYAYFKSELRARALV